LVVHVRHSLTYGFSTGSNRTLYLRVPSLFSGRASRPLNAATVDVSSLPV